jgi:hypothetical protein
MQMNAQVQEACTGDVEQWVHQFLNGAGDNAALSKGLKLQQRYWAGPTLISLEELNRCCGPEESMEYIIPSDYWEVEIKNFRELIRSGWEIPPLIAEHKNTILSVRDGNHRLEAMRREGYSAYWVIVWDNEDRRNISKWDTANQ